MIWKKKEKRGNINIDFIMSIVILLGAITFILVNLNSLIPSSAPRVELGYEGDLVSNKLLQYFSYQNKSNILDQTKLDNMGSCSDIDIGLNAGFHVRIDSKSKSWECSGDFNSGLPQTIRPVYVKLRNGRYSPGIMRVWVWGEAI